MGGLLSKFKKSDADYTEYKYDGVNSEEHNDAEDTEEEKEYCLKTKTLIFNVCDFENIDSTVNAITNDIRKDFGSIEKIETIVNPDVTTIIKVITYESREEY